MDESGVVETPSVGEDSRPLMTTAQVLGRKWHPVIVHELLETGPCGFNDLRASIDDISGKMLSESLKDLEERGLVDREVVSDRPFRVVYDLTARGEALAPVIRAMVSWGSEHLDLPDDSGQPHQ